MGAAQEGEVNCLSYLTEKGANVNTKNEDGNTALMYATQGGKTECLDVLMEKGAYLNTQKYSTSGACIISPCTDVNATGWVSAAPRPCFPAAALTACGPAAAPLRSSATQPLCSRLVTAASTGKTASTVSSQRVPA